MADLPELPPGAGAARDEQVLIGLTGRLGRLLRALLWIGILLMAAGGARQIAQQGTLGHETAPLAELPARLLALRGSGFFTLGILVFLITPAVGLAYAVVGFFRAGDRTYALVALAVLAIVLGGMLLSRG